MTNDAVVARTYGKNDRVKRLRGFTLVELMVVLAVMAILASVAFPLYTNQVTKSRRAEARVALSEIALAQERYFTLNGRYGSAAQLGTSYTDALGKMTDVDGAAGPDFYAIAVADTSTSFTLTATAQGAQLKDAKCTSFTLNQLGVKSATGSETDICW